MFKRVIKPVLQDAQYGSSDRRSGVPQAKQKLVVEELPLGVVTGGRGQFGEGWGQEWGSK